jgi:16S rRNA processing protein RimM
MNASDSAADSMRPAGSPPPGEPAFLVVGKLRRPHGTQGEILMEVFTDFPERLKPGSTVYAGDAHQPLSIRSLRWNKGLMLLSFRDHDTPEEVGNWRSHWVYVLAENLPELEQGEYYHHQIIGLRAVLETGGLLGEVVNILETGSNDVLVVKMPDGKEVLLPMTDEVVKKVDLPAGEVRVYLLPGLLP